MSDQRVEIIYLLGQGHSYGLVADELGVEIDYIHEVYHEYVFGNLRRELGPKVLEYSDRLAERDRRGCEQAERTRQEYMGAVPQSLRK